MSKLPLLLVIAGWLLIAGAAFAQDTTWYNDFEGDLSAWRHLDYNQVRAESTYWHRETDYHATGNSTVYWWCANPAFRGYDNEWLQYLTTETIDLSGRTGELTLTFRHNYKVETSTSTDTYPEGYDSWDGVNVRISTDAGATFTEIAPIGGYPRNSRSMYGFGWNGEGINHPGWNTSSRGWVDATFNLSSYAGQQVQVRFAFGSDPGFCTVDHGAGAGSWDSTMFGWQLDDIAFSESGVPFWQDNGDDIISSFSTTNGVHFVPDMWTVADDRYNSPTHAWHTGIVRNMFDGLISPPITLSPDGIPYLSYHAYFDVPSYDYDGDNSFEVRLMWEASSDDGATWKIVAVDGRWPDEATAEWVYRDSAWVYDSASGYLTPGKFDMSAFVGQTIILQAVMIAQDTVGADVGTGIWIDDVAITTLNMLHRDVGPTQIGIPVMNRGTVRDSCHAIIANLGLDSDMFTGIRWRVTGSDGTPIASGTPRSVTLAFGESKPISFLWNPDTAGTFTLTLYTVMGEDENLTNDTLRTEVTVYDGVNQKELGYDDGWTDSSGTSGFHYLYVGGAGQGFAVAYDLPVNVQLRKLRYYSNGTFDFRAHVWRGDTAAGPTTDLMTPIDAHMEALIPGWLDIPLPDVAVTRAGFYFVGAEAIDTIIFGCNSHGGDVSEMSWAHVPADTITGTLAWYNMARDFGTFAGFDMMFRLVYYNPNGVEETMSPTVPRGLTLNLNGSNPVRGNAELMFGLPTKDNVDLAVYDMTGARVARLVEGERASGSYSVTWEPGSVPSGSYLVRLNTSAGSVEEHITIIR